MRYGHSIGTDIIYSPFFSIGVLLIAMTIVFIVFLAPTRTKPEHERILEILNIRYAKSEITEKIFYEIKSILKEEDTNSPAILILKERYASGNISSVDFIKMRDELNLSFS